MTRRILATDKSVGQRIASMYHQLLHIVVEIQNARSQQGVPPEEVSNFTLGIRLRYDGATMEELGHEWGKTLAEALREALKNFDPRGADPNNG